MYLSKLFKFRFVTHALLVTALFLLSSCTDPGKNEKKIIRNIDKVSLRLPIPVVDAAFAPYYLAQDKKIFEKFGLEVAIEPGSPELNPVKTVSQGIDEFGVLGGPELLLSGRNKGARIVGIAQIHRNSNFVVILTLKKSGIVDLQQLNGKKVGFFFGHISKDILDILFKKENITVQQVDVGFDYGQLLSGNVDAQWAFRTTAGISLRERGIELNTIYPANYGVTTQGHIIVAGENLIRDSTELVQRFSDAIVEALKYTLEHPDEAVQATLARDPSLNPKIAQEQVAVYAPLIMDNSTIGLINRADMEKTMQQMQSVELLPEGFKVDSAFVTNFVLKMQE